MKIAFIDIDGTLFAPVYEKGNRLVAGLPTGPWEAYCDEKRSTAYEHCEPVMPVIDFAIRLQKAEYKLKTLSAVSCKSESNAKIAHLARTGAGNLFSEFVFVGSDAEKMAFLKAFVSHIEHPEECLLIEDSYPNILEAGKLGITPIHISHIICGIAERLINA